LHPPILAVRPNTVNVIGVLVASLAHAQFETVFDRFFPLCARKIRSELENGASSVPTTSASMPLASDTTLHAYMAILSGMLSWTTPAILKHQDELISLLAFMGKTARNERSWSITSRMMLRVITRLTTVWAYDAKFINSDEWSTEGQ
jgi:proteasome activator subunit 4